ncbi:alpha/beta hydrolase [Streptomyces cavernae]|uniref:alpha/beta hydrolase n=1 Tax=Streptomyces cavernae TaxID=2259034 RepID=UPI001EE497B1|nr:alpha/beta hydrolase [Streptomyces cavernae]
MGGARGRSRPEAEEGPDRTQPGTGKTEAGRRFEDGRRFEGGRPDGGQWYDGGRRLEGGPLEDGPFGRASASGRGVPWGRVRRAVLAGVVAAAVALPVSAAARPRVPAPPPAQLGTVSAATLDTAYAANRANITEAARMAEAHGDHRRASAERTMAVPTRHFLTFDGRGPGRAAEVFGDLAHATRVAVLVPGSDTTLDTYERFRAGAFALHKRLEGTSTARTAVVAWLGYETPGTVSPAVLTTGRADEAAPGLRAFVSELRGIAGPDAALTLLCHSYGSVVCARAAGGLAVSDIALFGSPGTGADSVEGLHTSARVWAARGADDWIANVPHTRADLFGTTLGFGTDPVSPAFGARVFSARDADHSGYLAPGSHSLANLARIVLGETAEVG